MDEISHSYTEGIKWAIQHQKEHRYDPEGMRKSIEWLEQAMLTEENEELRYLDKLTLEIYRGYLSQEQK